VFTLALVLAVLLIGCSAGQPTPPSSPTTAVSAATILEQTPVASPAPPPPPPPPQVLEEARIISYYGHPFSPVMGILGEGSMEAIFAKLQHLGAEFGALDPAREVKLAFHLVYAVAQASAGSDGLHIYHTDPDVVQRFVDFTREHDMLLFLDLQNGRADPVEEAKLVLPYLLEPHIHLALDPEFTLAPHQQMGVSIGSLDGHQINEVQALLSSLALEHGLAPKILIVHQFLDSMVTNKEVVTALPGVDVVFAMDGYGGAEAKISKYHLYAVEAPARFRSIKLFYRWDVGLLTPWDLLSIDPPPDIIIYQ
jgi:hypothetical protein